MGWRVSEDDLKKFLISSDSKGHAMAVTNSWRSPDIENALRDQIKTLQDVITNERERSQKAESENRQLNAEIKAILAQKSGLNLKGVLSRWVRT